MSFPLDVRDTINAIRVSYVKYNGDTGNVMHPYEEHGDISLPRGSSVESWYAEKRDEAESEISLEKLKQTPLGSVSSESTHQSSISSNSTVSTKTKKGRGFGLFRSGKKETEPTPKVFDYSHSFLDSNILENSPTEAFDFSRIDKEGGSEKSSGVESSHEAVTMGPDDDSFLESDSFQEEDESYFEKDVSIENLYEKRSELPVTEFAKIEPRPRGLSSALSDMMAASPNHASPEDLLKYYSFVEDDTGLKLTVYCLNQQFDVRVSKTASVAETVGFILFQLSRKKLTSNLYPNKWCLKLADDGEPLEEFGVLKRDSRVASYGTDEVALCEVTDDEMKQNDQQFPLPFAKRGISQKYHSMIPAEEPAAFNFEKLTLSKSADGSSLIQRIKKEEASKPQKSKPKLKVSTSFRKRTPPLTLQTPSSAIHNFSNENFQRLTTFHKWTVYRRQPMSFKMKSERTLALDGEYVYILPFSDNRSSSYDNFNIQHRPSTMKTKSFHLSQIVKAKQSSKYPLNFKIAIQRNEGLKRYDLATRSYEESKEIVDVLNKALSIYRMNRG